MLCLVQAAVLATTAIVGDSPASTSEAATRAAGVTDGSQSWVFSVTPYVWMYGLDGDVRIRSAEADFDVSFGDILENLDVALMLHAEAWRGRFGFFLDPSYGRLMTEAESNNVDVDVETDLILVDFGGFYRVLDQRSEGLARTADISLGGRYVYLKNEIDFAAATDRRRSNDFVDLTVGARYSMDLTRKVGLMVGGDVGGFDFGSSSEFAWNAEALSSFRIGESGRLWAGYRILDFDRDDGGSSGLDVQFSGPIVGYEFRL